MIIKPSLNEAADYAKTYNTIPLSTVLEMNYTPLGIIKKIKAVSTHCFMLESADDTKRTGRYTFIGFDPKAEISCTDYEVQIVDDSGVRKFRGNPKEYVREMLESHKSPKFDSLPTFTGGLVGYFGYDYIKYSESGLNLNAKDDGNFKDIDLMLFDKVIAFDNLEEKIILIANIQTDQLEQNYNTGVKELEIMKNIIDNQPIIEPELPTLKSDFKSLFNGEEYSAMVEKAKHYIVEGDIFQVVLSNRMEAEMESSLFKPYEILRHLNPSPYMFYFSSDDIEIAGASPETLVKLENKTLYTYPLAGSRPRGRTQKEDLTYDEAKAAVNEIMSGDVSSVVTSSFLTALAMKGETDDEIAGAAEAMRSKAVKFELGCHALDVVGTGGDKSDSFNTSTTAGFVAAAAGVTIAKHGRKDVEWSMIPKTTKPFFLAGGLDESNIETAIYEINPYCVDLSSAVETDGVKDYSKIKKIIEIVRSTNNE